VFGLSFTEVVIIAVLALVLLGPEQLPNAARTAGKWMREFRRATEDLKDQIETEIYTDERKTGPSLVPPVPAAPLPSPVGPPPAATALNVPGLEAALAEPAAPEAPPQADPGAPDQPKQA
jgi:sec-independent protein translocase protein TatB